MKAILNYRYWLLEIVALIAIAGILCVPSPDEQGIMWAIVTLLCSKVVGIVFAFLFVGLYQHFDAKGTIPELTNFINNF